MSIRLKFAFGCHLSVALLLGLFGFAYSECCEQYTMRVKSYISIIFQDKLEFGRKPNSQPHTPS